MGECGRTELQAALTSMSEYHHLLDGKEKEMRRRYEVARWEVYMMMTPYYQKGRRPATAVDFCRFPWEKGGITTEEEAKDALERARVSEQEAKVLDSVFERLNRKLNNG